MIKDFYIAVDFDGTIVEHQYPNVGPAVPDAIYWLRQWEALGAKLILWTMRSDKELSEAIAFLGNNQLSFYGINNNPDQASWSTSPKAYAHLYIDDAAFGCPLLAVKGKRPYVDWAAVGPAVAYRLKQS